MEVGGSNVRHNQIIGLDISRTDKKAPISPFSYSYCFLSFPLFLLFSSLPIFSRLYLILIKIYFTIAINTTITWNTSFSFTLVIIPE